MRLTESSQLRGLFPPSQWQHVWCLHPCSSADTQGRFSGRNGDGPTLQGPPCTPGSIQKSRHCVHVISVSVCRLSMCGLQFLSSLPLSFTSSIPPNLLFFHTPSNHRNDSYICNENIDLTASFHWKKILSLERLSARGRVRYGRFHCRILLPGKFCIPGVGTSWTVQHVVFICSLWYSCYYFHIPVAAVHWDRTPPPTI